MAADTPDWDLEQLKVISEDASSWQLVSAGPGSGKSAVACQRVAYLIDQGIPPSRILIISFTRTAVAEIRDRIVSYAVFGERARSVRISTIDSHAWSLRAGFEDEVLKSVGGGSYDLSIIRTTELFRQRDPDLLDFISRLEHLIIDEAQDVVAARSDLMMEVLGALSRSCGVTVLADSSQAIYGFTTDDDDPFKSAASLLVRLPTESPRPLLERELRQNHRVQSIKLAELFLLARKAIESTTDSAGHVARVQAVIREACGIDVGVTSYPNIAKFLGRVSGDSMLVLFRRRADVLFASSYCSSAGVIHRLRIPDVPIVVRPWIGWLFGETIQSHIGKAKFEDLWESRMAIAAEPFRNESRDEGWQLLHRICAGKWPDTLDLEHLRRVVARPRPPIELCYPDLGAVGPILGTIHASKGREADTVMLMMPPPRDEAATTSDEEAQIFEEGRVYYVGATRARKMLVVAGTTAARVSELDSRRMYHKVGATKAQLEVGRAGDVDHVAHLGWDNALETQRVLASCVGVVAPTRAVTRPEEDYRIRIVIEHGGMAGETRKTEVGELSDSFRHDLKRLWGKIDVGGQLKPALAIPHLYLVAVTTIGIADDQRSAVRHPFNQSGLALAPVIKGLPAIQFYNRSQRRSS
jgi:hypothetical protein